MRINISISDSLRERMRPYDSTTNWSEVCTVAIEKYLHLLEVGQESTSLVFARRRIKELEEALKTVIRAAQGVGNIH